MSSVMKNARPSRTTAALPQPVEPSGAVTDVKVLLVSPNLEVRQPLTRTLYTLAADTISVPRASRSPELLARREIDVVFCDEHLASGSYRDLIHPNHYARKVPRVVVTTRTGEWDLYFKALGNGAFDIVRAPVTPRISK